jgi:prefoldin beta subunit
MTKQLTKMTEEKIAHLQLIEQNLQSLISQRQNFQSQAAEIDNAMEELEKAGDEAYKLVGLLMVLSKKEDLKKDLLSRKEIIELRIKSIEKQEQNLQEKCEKMRSEVMKELK